MTSPDRQRLAGRFEQHRPYLRSVAYSILGSLTEAEDAIQLARRTRSRIRAAVPSPDADISAQRRMVDAFLASTWSVDFDALFDILASDVVLEADVGAIAGTPRRSPLVGAGAVVDQVRSHGGEFAPFAQHAFVNGSPGLVVRPPNAPPAVVSFTVAGGRITAIDIIGKPKAGSRL